MMDGALDGMAGIALGITATSEKGPLDELFIKGIGDAAGATVEEVEHLLLSPLEGGW
jgi:hypothetical protein